MDIRAFIGITAFLLMTSVNAAAEAKLGRLIKDQQNNDSATLQESKVEKKDVFSQAPAAPAVDSQFPQETPCYRIDELVIEHDFLNDRGLRKIKQTVAGRCLGVKGLGKAAVLVQDYFIRAGYVTTRVETPDQDLLTKKLTLNVMAGRISDVEVTDNDIRPALLPFKKGDILNIRDIEQGLENIQRTPGVDVQIKILPGSDNGTSRIQISPQRKTRWNVRTSYSNFGDSATGSQLMGATGYVYNPVGINDLFYLAGTSSQTGGYKNVSAYYSFPFGYNELSLLYSDSKSTQDVDVGRYRFDYVGKTAYFSLKGSRMLHRDMNSKLSASAEFIRRKYDYTFGGEELVLQKRDMGNIRLGLNYKQNFTGAMLDSTLSWQRFITELGGTETPDMRTGNVSKQSQIVNMNMNFVKWLNSLPADVYYDMNLGIQYAPENLTLQDKFTIGNRWTVRGFENSSGIDGNSGYFIQNTLNMNTGYPFITLYAGVDYGQVSGNVSPQDSGGKKLMGGALGLKGNVKSLDYDLSLSRPFIRPNNMDVDNYTVSFNLGYLL